LAEEQMIAVFRARCLRAVEASGCAFGVFGHVHRAHLHAGDRYVNAGGLHDDRLEYFVLDEAGPRLASLEP
jgi:UDP-2,3-diacylglucosamine pyrophosphatase LpxH